MTLATTNRTPSSEMCMRLALANTRTTARRLLACALLLLPTVPLVATAQGGAPDVPLPVIVRVPKFNADVTFAPGATGITAPQREMLGRMVSRLAMQCEAQNWYVDGYADAGEVKHHPDGGNRLALDRASNVADLLVLYGVQRESICLVSRGSRHPAVQPPDIRNARVEIMGICDMRPVRCP